RPEDQRRDAQEQTEAPHQQTTQLGILGPTHSPVRHRVNQRHVAIQAHQNQEVDTAVGTHLDTRVDHFAHGQTERPVEIVGDVDGPKGKAGHQDEVGSRQVAQVDFGHRARLLVQAEHQQHEGVQHHSERGDDPHVDGLAAGERLPHVWIDAVLFNGVILASVGERGAQLRYSVGQSKGRFKLTVSL
uniref:Uncharacterized protein n=1 Tax=Hippocampus comes TaxID=109280 RepID=A0A3Q3DPW2_HIPCM